MSQARKGTGVPYAAHLIGVSSLVLEAGGDEDIAVAALLHDAAEDHGGESRLADIEERFGVRVAGIVRDKVHNGRAIVTDLESHGSEVLSRFHAAPGRILWYYEPNLALAERRHVPDALLVPLRAAVARLRVLLAAG